MASPFALHCALVAPERAAAPAQWLVVLHGIFGSGNNWRTFARRLVGKRPEWGAVLVDLRMHGESQGAPPPHTLGAAAADVVALVEQLRDTGHVVRGIAGHSFGGKVALAVADDLPGELERVFVLDSDPAPDLEAMSGDRPTVKVLSLLARLPREHESRAAFVTAVVEAGLDRGLAQWLAMNVVVDGDVHRMRLDSDAMRSLLTSYYASDLWPTADRVAGDNDMHFVLGADSPAVSPVSKSRMKTLRAGFDEIAAAGHWLHVDAPDALLDIMARGL